MEKPIVTTIPAKINLSLEILGKAKSLHMLKMTVARSYMYCDEIKFIPNDGKYLNDIIFKNCYDGFDEYRFLKFFAPRAQFIAKRLDVGGRLVISKRIPLGAGLGGSSACLAGAVLTMQKYAREIGKSAWLDNEFLLSLGSDVPCMMDFHSCIVGGVGQRISYIEIPFSMCDMVIKIAEGGSDTTACYALYDDLKAKGLDTSKISELDDDTAHGIEVDEIRYFKNDLTLPAVTLNPKIKDLILDLKKEYEYVVMSGSGSSVIAMCRKSDK